MLLEPIFLVTVTLHTASVRYLLAFACLSYYDKENYLKQ